MPTCTSSSRGTCIRVRTSPTSTPGCRMRRRSRGTRRAFPRPSRRGSRAASPAWWTSAGRCGTSRCAKRPRSGAAPRVHVAGPLISMVARPQLDLGDPPIIRISTPDEARALVRRELARKPDFIKVWYIHREADDLAAQEAIVRATAEEAHRAGVRLAVHATELVVAKSALRAGADYLVHSVDDAPLDDEFLAL